MTKQVVGFSGGADSQACALYVRRKYPPEDVLLINSDPGGNEHQATYGFIRWYSENVFPVKIVHPIVADVAEREPGSVAKLGLTMDTPLTFELLAKIKQRFPSNYAKFCTEFLKMAPRRRHLQELGTEGYEMWTGIRRDESTKRRNAPEREWDDYYDCYLNQPLVSWTKQQVFDYLAEAGEEVNPLYRMGFSRVGCSPCVEWGKDSIRNWAARSPEDVEKIRRWEREVGFTFFGPIMPGGRYGGIDEVIIWSKTTHGGKQLSLPILEAEAEGGGCSSKYGLCE
jgi:3'-phosphoadenosine 5'-phosphosulfate sulfotransferase (PAPS reductase)/FAD synthetase